VQRWDGPVLKVSTQKKIHRPLRHSVVEVTLSRRNVERLLELLDGGGHSAQWRGGGETEPSLLVVAVEDDLHYGGGDVRHVAAFEPHEIPPDGMIMHGTDQDIYLTGAGQGVSGTHRASACQGRGCVIHHPSDHHMRMFPTRWAYDTSAASSLMVRVCDHDQHHTDPDEIVDVPCTCTCRCCEVDDG